MNDLHTDWLSKMWMPHEHCVLYDPAIVWGSIFANLVIVFAYVAIPMLLAGIVVNSWARITREAKSVLLYFAVFTAACGMTHFWGAWNWKHADYGVELGVLIGCALISIESTRRIWDFIRLKKRVFIEAQNEDEKSNPV